MVKESKPIANRKEMKEEALTRMRLLNLDDATIRAFETHNCFSGNEKCKNDIAELEKRGFLVYYVINPDYDEENTAFVDDDYIHSKTFLAVSKDKRIWNYMRSHVAAGHPYVIEKYPWRDGGYNFTITGVEQKNRVLERTVFEPTKEDLKNEAIRRMELLGINSQDIKAFAERGIIYGLNGRESLVKDELGLTYYVINSYHTFGECASVLYVDDISQDWKYDIGGLSDGNPYAMVVNLTHPELSDLGTIFTERTSNGRLIRVG